MTPTVDETIPAPVRKTVTVNASLGDAFRVFTEEFDTWWPRTHHIGKVPMKRAIVEGRAGGRCYTEQVDGTECDWGTVLAWDPPHRLLLAWQIDYAGWRFEPDRAKASEVEVRFTAEAGGKTRVDLEHRHFERHGATGAPMRMAVDAPDGWGGILQLFVARIEQRQ